MTMITVGQRVTFHLLNSHVCGGEACRCLETELVDRPAAVVEIHDCAELLDRNDRVIEIVAADAVDAEDLRERELTARSFVLLDLDVELSEAELDSGLAPRQRHKRRATTTPPASGTWT